MKTSPSSSHAPKMVPWKQWLMISLIIWPLSICIPMLTSLILPPPDGLLLQMLWKGGNIFLIVGMVVFIILPRIIPVLSPWLFKHPTQKES